MQPLTLNDVHAPVQHQPMVPPMAPVAQATTLQTQLDQLTTMVQALSMRVNSNAHNVTAGHPTRVGSAGAGANDSIQLLDGAPHPSVTCTRSTTRGHRLSTHTFPNDQPYREELCEEDTSGPERRHRSCPQSTSAADRERERIISLCQVKGTARADWLTWRNAFRSLVIEQELTRQSSTRSYDPVSDDAAINLNKHISESDRKLSAEEMLDFLDRQFRVHSNKLG